MSKTFGRRLHCQYHEKMDVIHFYMNTKFYFFFFRGQMKDLVPTTMPELDHLKFHRERGD